MVSVINFPISGGIKTSINVEIINSINVGPSIHCRRNEKKQIRYTFIFDFLYFFKFHPYPSKEIRTHINDMVGLRYEIGFALSNLDDQEFPGRSLE